MDSSTLTIWTGPFSKGGWGGGGVGVEVCRVSNILSWRFDHEIFSTVILSLPLIQEGQLSVSGKRMCTILLNA